MAVRIVPGSAGSFHATLVEILRHLNQAAERQTGVDGLELGELARSMARYRTGELPEERIPEVLRVLEQNRMVQEDRSPIYAWDRGRVVGERYRITPDGKAYLLRQVESTERIA